MIFSQYAYPFIFPYNRTEQFHYSFIRDLIESGYLRYDLLYDEVYNRKNFKFINNTIKDKLINSKNSSIYIAQRIGFCLESFISYYLTMDNSVRLEMLRKCFRNANKTEAYSKNCAPINLGSYSTKLYKPEIIDTHNPHFDTIFVKRNNKGITPITNYSKSDFDKVGFQIKAIKSSLTYNIINPINKKKYPIVLTMLECENEYGDIIHTKAKCVATINSDVEKFNKREKKYLIDSIVCPEDIGIPQWIINEYYNYMWNAFNNNYDFSSYIANGIWLYNDYLRYLGTNVFKKALQIEQIPIPIINQDNDVEIIV